MRDGVIKGILNLIALSKQHIWMVDSSVVYWAASSTCGRIEVVSISLRHTLSTDLEPYCFIHKYVSISNGLIVEEFIIENLFMQQCICNIANVGVKQQTIDQSSNQ